METRILSIIFGSEGGKNRGKIIKELHKIPSNANQLSKKLDLNYRTIRYHLKLLKDENIVKCTGEKYGKVYFLSKEMMEKYDFFKGYWDQLKEK